MPWNKQTKPLIIYLITCSKVQLIFWKKQVNTLVDLDLVLASMECETIN